MKRIFIIIGGPGTGKTAVIEELEKQGYNVIHEAARELMATKYKNVFWKDVRNEFQKDVLKKQIKDENNAEGIVFMERGIPNALAYYESDNIEPFEELVKESKNRPYETAFYLELLENYEKDEHRLEESEEMLRLHKIIYNVYERLGYKIIRVPKMSIKERVDFILEKIGIKPSQEAP